MAVVLFGTVSSTSARTQSHPESSPGASSGNLEIAGGIEPIARMLDLDAEGPRALFLVRVIRRIYDAPWGSRENAAALLPPLIAYLQSPDRVRSAVIDEVPLPLGPAIWSDVILRRAVPPRHLVSAILQDRRASLLYHGLAALDDETLRFLAAHPDTLRAIRDDAAAAFSTLARSLRVREGRLVVPGGTVLRPAWEGLVGEGLARTDRFIVSLFSKDDGRLAFFFDTLAELDPPRFRFATAGADGAPAVRLREIYDVFREADPGWTIDRRPFARTAFDSATLLMTVDVDESGNLVGPRSRWLWQSAFDSVDESLPPERDAKGAGGGAVDAAWLVSRIGLSEPAIRQLWLRTLWFAQRVFPRPTERDLPNVLVALRGFGRYPMLALTLDRVGVRDPGLYARAVAKVSRLARIEHPARARVELLLLQSSLALIERLTFRGAVDATGASELIESLFDVGGMDVAFSHGHLSRWLDERVLPMLGGTPGGPDSREVETALLRGLAGLASPDASSPTVPATIEWEGMPYRVALGESAFRRLEEVRRRQQAAGLDPALQFVHEARRIAGDASRDDALRAGVARLTELVGASEPRGGPGTAIEEDGATVLEAMRDLASRIERMKVGDRSRADDLVTGLLDLGDRLLADALTSLVYACSLAEADGWLPEAGALARRHDFGLVPDEDERARAPWRLPVQVSGPGVRWHLTGSLLGLDVALASMSLRRISVEPPQRAPRLNENDRATFVQTLALINPRDLTEANRDAIAAGLKRGRQRLGRLVAAPDGLSAVADEIGLSAWRRRALTWMLVHEPGQVPQILSQRELLALGLDGPVMLDAWGVSAMPVDGSLRTRLSGLAPWENFSGRPMTGQLAALVPDLNLRMAEVLADRALPAVLARAALAPAVQSLIDEVQPADTDDWLSVVSYVRKIPAGRFDDYIASLAAGGPLIASPAAASGQHP